VKEFKMIEYTVKVYFDGSKFWYLNGKRHREDGHAVEGSDGYKAWWLNGKRHREDGPAIEYSDGGKLWYLDGKKLTEKQHKAATSKPTCEGKVVEIDGKKYELKEI
jgi:hypothetical protein